MFLVLLVLVLIQSSKNFVVFGFLVFFLSLGELLSKQPCIPTVQRARRIAQQWEPPGPVLLGEEHIQRPLGVQGCERQQQGRHEGWHGGGGQQQGQQQRQLGQQQQQGQRHKQQQGQQQLREQRFHEQHKGKGQQSQCRQHHR